MFINAGAGDESSIFRSSEAAVLLTWILNSTITYNDSKQALKQQDLCRPFPTLLALLSFTA